MKKVRLGRNLGKSMENGTEIGKIFMLLSPAWKLGSEARKNVLDNAHLWQEFTPQPRQQLSTDLSFLPLEGPVNQELQARASGVVCRHAGSCRTPAKSVYNSQI